MFMFTAVHIYPCISIYTYTRTGYAVRDKKGCQQHLLPSSTANNQGNTPINIINNRTQKLRKKCKKSWNNFLRTRSMGKHKTFLAVLLSLASHRNIRHVQIKDVPRPNALLLCSSMKCVELILDWGSLGTSLPTAVISGCIKRHTAKV